jgi:two-component sensor histidine kinase
MCVSPTHQDKQAQQLVQTSLHEKEALRKELHHRVKNNLHVITCLLWLEICRSDQAATKTVLDEMPKRIRGMSHAA